MLLQTHTESLFSASMLRHYGKNQLAPYFAALILPWLLILAGCGSSGGSGSHEVPGPIPDFSLNVSPNSLSLYAGSQGTFQISVQALNGFSGSVQAQISGVPQNATLTPSSPIEVSTTARTISIAINSGLAPGSYPLTITGIAGAITHSVTEMITIAPATTQTWVRSVAGIANPRDMVWDSLHGRLYVSIPSIDTISPNTIIPVDPVAGIAGTPVAAGKDPYHLALSSDFSHLWVGMDGDHAVQRLLLPGLTKDISFQLPLDVNANPQQAVSLEAAPVNSHTVAVVAGSKLLSPPGDGVYIYDDDRQRPASVPGWGAGGGPEIDWIQWGKDDSVIYGTSTAVSPVVGILPLQVSSSGVSWNGAGGGLQAQFIRYDRQKGLAYADGSSSTGAVFDPVLNTQVGRFGVPGGDEACTADASLGRFYCMAAYNTWTDIVWVELWTFDLNTYQLLSRVYFGIATTNSTITGFPVKLVRWGNSGLAVICNTDINGSGGLFLIDGAAVNPNAAPDVASGSSPKAFAWMSSLSPQEVPVGSGDITLTINGTNFARDSVAYSNINNLYNSLTLPTTFVSSTQLTATVPASALQTAGPRTISVGDQTTGLFATNCLFLTVSPASGSTQVTALNLAGLSMARDANSGLLYVGTSDLERAYPNSIVAISEDGSIAKTQMVSPNPYLLSTSANGQYLYVGYASSTNMTQLSLPGLNSPNTWGLINSKGRPVFALDLKAAPVSPHTTAVNLQSQVAIYDDATMRPVVAWGYSPNLPFPPPNYGFLAWGASDSILAAAESVYYGWDPLYALSVDRSGVTYSASSGFDNYGYEIHSDFGTGLIYSDDGTVANPETMANMGSFGASGLVAPDSSLNRVFILGQTSAQANSNSFTIESFDEKTYLPIASITINNLVGSPLAIARLGNSSLAILTSDIAGPGDASGTGAPAGMLYLIKDATFVSGAAPSGSGLVKAQELVQRRWKKITKSDILRNVQRTK